MKIPIDELDVENTVVDIGSLKVEFAGNKDPSSYKSKKEAIDNTYIILADGRKFQVTKRFWNSFGSLYNLGVPIFNYFDHSEVFQRIAERKSMMVRLSLEGAGVDSSGKITHGRLLSCTGPSKPVLRVDDVRHVVDLFKGDHAVYEDGIVQVSFPAPFPVQFNVAGNDFTTKFMMVLPIDGYGLPSAFLQMHRSESKTTISGFTKAFKTVFQLGKDDTSLVPVLDRALRTFNNEEGYHTFKQRLEMAAKSWASFFEAGQLHGLIESVLTAEGFDLDTKRTILNTYNEAVGNPLQYYGLTGANELSQRKAKTIMVKATVYDLFLFVTELTTHHVKTRSGSQKLNEWLGNKLAEEFDLEGTVTTNPEFKDFFLPTTQTIINNLEVGGEGDRLLEIGDVVVPTPVDAVEGAAVEGAAVKGAAVEGAVADGVVADAVEPVDVAAEVPKIVIPEARYVPAELDGSAHDMTLLWMNHAGFGLNAWADSVAKAEAKADEMAAKLAGEGAASAAPATLDAADLPQDGGPEADATDAPIAKPYKPGGSGLLESINAIDAIEKAGSEASQTGEFGTFSGEYVTGDENIDPDTGEFISQ
jgi:hypothetical protein